MKDTQTYEEPILSREEVAHLDSKFSPNPPKGKKKDARRSWWEKLSNRAAVRLHLGRKLIALIEALYPKSAQSIRPITAMIAESDKEAIGISQSEELEKNFHWKP